MKRPSGYSLLEVLLALAVLTLAGAALGELARLGMRNARVARDRTLAEFHCESKLAEILATGALPEPVQAQPLEAVDPSDMGWLYSVDVESTEHEGIVALRVTVIEDLPVEQRPVECTLVRWLVDPQMEAEAAAAMAEATDDTTNSGSSTGGTNSGGNAAGASGNSGGSSSGGGSSGGGSSGGGSSSQGKSP